MQKKGPIRTIYGLKSDSPFDGYIQIRISFRTHTHLCIATILTVCVWVCSLLQLYPKSNFHKYKYTSLFPLSLLVRQQFSLLRCAFILGLWIFLYSLWVFNVCGLAPRVNEYKYTCIRLCTISIFDLNILPPDLHLKLCERSRRIAEAILPQTKFRKYMHT